MAQGEPDRDADRRQDRADPQAAARDAARPARPVRQERAEEVHDRRGAGRPAWAPGSGFVRYRCGGGGALMGYEASLRVWRGDAGSGSLVDYTVEVNEGEVILDVLHRLQATQASDLAIRWNCKAGKCGSCSMEINRRPRLACMTRMSVFTPEETLTITPLRTFPVIRDLVTDVSFNYAKARVIAAFT